MPNDPILNNDDYIDTGSGYNTKDADSIRDSFIKTNDALQALDDKKANLDGAIFWSPIKGPAVISADGNNYEYITLKDIEDYLNGKSNKNLVLDSPYLKGDVTIDNQLSGTASGTSSAISKADLDQVLNAYAPLDSPEFTGNQPTWDGKALLVEADISNILADTSRSRFDINNSILGSDVQIYDGNGNERNIATEHWVENANHTYSGTATFDDTVTANAGLTSNNTKVGSGQSSVLTVDDYDSVLPGDVGNILNSDYGIYLGPSVPPSDSLRTTNPFEVNRDSSSLITDIPSGGTRGRFYLYSSSKTKDLDIENLAGGDISLGTENNTLTIPHTGDAPTFNGDDILTLGNLNNKSVNADKLDGKEGSYYLDSKNFFSKTPNGERIYVSSRYGSDSNYGYTPQTAVASIKQAAINAYALQAPETLDGYIRRDVYRLLEWNRKLIVEEIGLIANEFDLCGKGRTSLTYRDANDLYGALAKDLLLNTNRNIRLVTRELYEVGTNIAQAWNTSIDLDYNGDGNTINTTLFNHLLRLMASVIYNKDSASNNKAQVKDFQRVISLYGQDFVENNLTFSDRDDTNVNTDNLFNEVDKATVDALRDAVNSLEFLGETNTPLYNNLQVRLTNALEREELTKENKDDPCTYLRQYLLEQIFPSTSDIDSEIPYRSPNQANRDAYSIIRIESGTYVEEYPIELPDKVSVFGDSLRRVTVMPTEEIKQKGCGLHQRFKSHTFTFLNNGSDTWDSSILINYDNVSGDSLPTSTSVFSLASRSSISDIEDAIEGTKYSIVYDGKEYQVGTVESAQFIGSGDATRLKLTFETPSYGFDSIPPEATGLTIKDLDRGQQDSNNSMEQPDLYNGYLLLRDNADEPLRLTGGTFSRGTALTPTFTFKNSKTPKFKLRKGDVLLLLDVKNHNRYELVRVDEHEEFSDGSVSSSFNTVRHRLNEAIQLEDAYVYMAPRAEWQTQCTPRVFERGFTNENNTYPSTEVVTNSEEVGQNAFHVGNANYCFQFVFREHTNFAYAFRRNRPRVFASPYVQNCSSITTKGGGGILVDGFIPRQPDSDFPQSVFESSVSDLWPDADLTDLRTLANLFFDGANLIEDNLERWIIYETFENTQAVQDALDGLSDKVNYDNAKAKCKRDARLFVQAIVFQMQRGGNDKVYDYAFTARTALMNQIENDSDFDTTLSEVLSAYDTIIDYLKIHTANLVKPFGDPDNPLSASDYDIVADDTSDPKCSDVVSSVESFWEVIRTVLNGEQYSQGLDRTNYVAVPNFVLNRQQNSELRSFVLDAFTQINTYGGWGHLIRNNGYAQLVSTFTTFCDHGVRVESGGLINLSNSVSDFGFFGLLSDGYSETHYLRGELYDSSRGARPGDTPSTDVYVDPRTLAFNTNNPVYQQRSGEELATLIADYDLARSDYEDKLNDGNSDTPTLQERDDLEFKRRKLEEAAVDAVQFNTTLFFEPTNKGIYNFYRDGNHLPSDRQIPRNLAYVDRPDEVSDIALNSYQSTNATELGDIDEELMIRNPTIRVGLQIDQRIPNATETGLQQTPLVQEGTEIQFYITTTLTSSSHGFEYVGSGNDYTQGLPENGGTPDASKQLLETNGGRVYASSTDVRGDFRVGPFFEVKQSTGAVKFSPSSLELINITSIGPFRKNGVLGSNVIRDLTNSFTDLLPQTSTGADNTTIATVNAIKGALNDTFISLSNRVSSALLRSEANAKLLEAVQNPIPDFGTWAARHCIFHRNYQLLRNDETTIEYSGFGANTPWPEVRDFDSFLYEFGSKVTGDLVPSGQSSRNEFRNRSSYTFNLIIDSSESMAQSAEFWQTKLDLINFLYNVDQRDSIALFNFSDSTVNELYITVSGTEIFEHLKVGQVLESFHPNEEGNSLVAYVAESGTNGWEDTYISFKGTKYFKIGQGEVAEIGDPPERKIKLTNVKGFFNEGLLTRIKSEDQILLLTGTQTQADCPDGYTCYHEDDIIILDGDTSDECPPDTICFTTPDAPSPGELATGDLETREFVSTIEYGLQPKIFNSSIGTDQIRRAFPNFDFTGAMRNGLLRELGVVLPDTNKVSSDSLLEVEVWGALQNSGYDTEPGTILNNSKKTKPHIAPGPTNYTNDSTSNDQAEIWVNGPVDGTSSDPFIPLDPTYDYANDGTARTENYWFYADTNPADNSNNSNITSKFRVLPPRSAVSGPTAQDYKVADIEYFNKYDPSSDPDGWLTADQFNSYQFLKEIKSNPKLDFAVITHNRIGGSDSRAQAEAMRGFMRDLDSIGIFDWKVAKLSTSPGISDHLYIRDFYLEDPSEPPRRSLFKDSGAEFQRGADRTPITGIDQRNISVTHFSFAPDNGSNAPDTSQERGDTLNVEGDSEFWLNLGSVRPPIHKGTDIVLANRDATINIDYNDLTFDSQITAITMSNPDDNLQGGDTVRISFGSYRNGGERHQFNASFTVTLASGESISAGSGSKTISIQETNNSGLQDFLPNLTSNEGDPLHDGTNRSIYPGPGNYLSGDYHPMFDYILEQGTRVVWDSTNDEYVTETYTREYRFPGWRHRPTIEESRLSVTVQDVKYPDSNTDDLYIKVSVPSGEWTKASGATKVINYGQPMDIRIGNEHETMYIGGRDRGSARLNQSTMKRISDACIGLNWRGNSYKAIALVSETPEYHDRVFWGGYYYAQNSGLGRGNRVLLRRLDYVMHKMMRNEFPELFEGDGLEAVWNSIKDGTITFPDNFYSNSEFETFIDTLGGAMMNNGAPVHAWYIGYTKNSKGNVITENGVSAEPGTVNRAGRLIYDADGNLYLPSDYASYMAAQEDLLFGDIDQLHLATREDIYLSPDQGRVFRNTNNTVSEVSNFGGLLSIHNVTNFSDNLINAVTNHRATLREYRRISPYELDTGTGYNYDTGNYNSNFFVNQWNDKEALLPQGQWKNWWDVRRSNWLKNLSLEIQSALGEGQGIMYSEFGDSNGDLLSSNRADEPAGYKELISDTATFGSIGYTDSDGKLVKSPHPAILPSPSIGKELLANATNADPVPGLTLSGKSAVYEAFAVAAKDASVSEQNTLDNDRRTTVSPRNPARSGTVNVNAIISDGNDNASFDDLVARHFINYDPNGEVDVFSTAKNLFYELFMDEGGNVQLDGNVPIQQKHIYTSEVINTLHILSYALAGTRSLTTIRVDTGVGFGDEDSSFDLPLKVFSNEEYDNSTELFPGRGVADDVVRMVNTSDNDIPLVDSMGLIPPFYRGAQDALPALVAARPIRVSQNIATLSNRDTFPNPYRFTAYKFPTKESKQFRGSSSIPDSSSIFTNLGEEGPSISFELDIGALNVDDNMIYNTDSNETAEERQVVLPNRVRVTLYSKLGYLHAITPDIEKQGIATQIVVLDPGYGQQTSRASQVLAQNLGGVDGTAFRQPAQIVGNELNERNLVVRNQFGFPSYRQNTAASLVEQRINYIENGFRESAKRSQFTSGVPLVSRRYVGTQLSGEYSGNIKDVGGDLFLTRVDRNGNNRNSIFRWDSSASEWVQVAGSDLGTGGQDQEIIDFKEITFEGSSSPVALVKDRRKDGSKILVFSNNIWQTLVDTDTLIYDPIRDPSKSEPYKIDLQDQEYFSNIVQVNGVTHISVTFKGGGYTISTSDDLTSLSVITNSINWAVSSHLPDAQADNFTDFVMEAIDDSDLSESSVLALRDTSSGHGGYYIFDRSVKLNRDNYVRGNENMDPDTTDASFDPATSYYLTLNASRNSPFSITSPFVEVEGANEWDPSDSPPSTGQGPDQYVQTVIGDPNVAEDTDGSALHDGIFIHFQEDSILQTSNSRWDRLSAKTDIIAGQGAFLKTPMFHGGSTAGTDVYISYLDLGPDDRLLNILGIDVQNHDPHVTIMRFNDVDPSRAELYIAESTGLSPNVGNRPSSSWNVVDSGLGLPKAEDNSECKPLDFFKTSNYLVAAFGDSTNTDTNGRVGNQVKVYGLPFVDVSSSDPSPTELLSTVSPSKSESDADEYLYSCMPADRGDSIVIVQWQPNNRNQYAGRLYYDSGSGTWKYELLLKFDEVSGPAVDVYTDDGTTLVTTLDGDLESVQLSGVSYDGTNHFYSVASTNNNESTIIRDDATEQNDVKNGTQIPYRPFTDPNVYPRYPHGDNWIRDASIGVNQGFFIASVDAPVSRNFSWNAQRYEQDLLYDTIRDTLEEYQSPI